MDKANENREKNHGVRSTLTRKSKFSEHYLDDNIRTAPFTTSNVTNELSSQFPIWDNLNPVLIDASTGSGKSTLILRHIYPYAEKSGHKILIVANRVGLLSQYKYSLLRQLNSDILRRYSDDGIQEEEWFESAMIVSYQSLPRVIRQYKNHELPYFRYVIFDECHFFTSDSLFVRDTCSLLEQIPTVFTKSVRIYMTATPWTIRNLIAQFEAQRSIPSDIRTKQFNSGMSYYENILRIYRFNPKPVNYLLYWLPSLVRDDPSDESLLTAIDKTKSEEKWLIFVETVEQGTALSLRIEDSVFINATTKRTETWKQLIKEEKFNCRVLISTSVADCGVNINDKRVKHIVLLTIDHTQFMQELGRKRIADNEAVSIYIPKLTKLQLQRRKIGNDKLIEQIDEFNTFSPSERASKMYSLWYDGEKIQRHIFCLDSKRFLFVNRCAEALLRQRKWFYGKLLEQYNSESSEPFCQAVCEWLHLDYGETDHSLCGGSAEDLMKEFIAFLDSSCNAPMESEDAFRKFADSFREYRLIIWGPRDKDNRGRDKWGHRIIQSELEVLNLPYKLSVNKSVWTLSHIDSVV